MPEQWTVEHDQAARRFVVALGDEQAVLNYYLRGDALVITHTGVPRAWEGRGIAASLTRAALEYARSQGLSVVPDCSYAAAYLRQHPEYSDLSNSD
jgi:predicted GNAT family acetyltransferase